MSPTAPYDEDDAPPSVLSAVVDQREKLLRAICALTGLDQHGAEDVLSTVTERVLRNGLVPTGESWFAYMRDAARNEASNERRSAERAAEREVTAYVLAGGDRTVDAVAARMVWLDAMADLERLPDVERQVFWQRHYEGLSYADIARALDLTVSGVDARLRQAAKRLREMHAARETNAGYLLLALLCRPARRASLGAPPALAVAGVAVLSVVAVMAAPVPRLSLADTPQRDAVVAAMPVRPTVVAAPPARRDAERAPDAVTAGPRAERRQAAPRPGDPRLDVQIDRCIGPACVRTGGGAGLSGDVITLQRLNGPAISQYVTPLCWAVPDNPEVKCESTGGYVVPPRQDPPGTAGKSNPSAPATKEPSKGPVQ